MILLGWRTTCKPDNKFTEMIRTPGACEDQQPPPHPRPPPPPPVACFDLEHFKHHVPILDHWNQHDIALQYFRHVARLVGDTSLRFDAADTCFMPKPETKRGRSYTFDHCSGADKRWCWHELVAQLDDASLQLVV